eukprot:8270900-Pyramimonas_sp.AAC.1
MPSAMIIAIAALSVGQPVAGGVKQVDVRNQRTEAATKRTVVVSAVVVVDVTRHTGKVVQDAFASNGLHLARKTRELLLIQPLATHRWQSKAIPGKAAFCDAAICAPYPVVFEEQVEGHIVRHVMRFELLGAPPH